MQLMRSSRPSWIRAAAVVLVAAWLGCGRSQTPHDSGRPSGPSGVSRVGQGTPPDKSPPSKTPSDDRPSPRRTIPEVVMAEAQRNKCLVWVGNIMPEVQLADHLEGIPRPLDASYGEKLTVVCFWRSGESRLRQEAAVQMLEDLQNDFYLPYRDKGVQVIGINVGDDPQVARQRIAEAEATFPNLVDPDEAFFAKVATEGLPRIYLLDQQGRILWLDREFSPTTRRRLQEGIEVALGAV